MKTIELTQGKSAIVDDDDYELVRRYKWFAAYDKNRRTYTARSTMGRGKAVLLSRFLLNPPDGYCVDHINHDKLDNRRCNLRVCTYEENGRNKRKMPGHSSRYKGVSRCGSSVNPWRAQLRIGKTRFHLGCYSSEEQAARVYDRKAVELFGEFAELNFSNISRAGL